MACQHSGCVNTNIFTANPTQSKSTNRHTRAREVLGVRWIVIAAAGGESSPSFVSSTFKSITSDFSRFDDGEVVRYGAGESWRPTPRGGNDNRGRERDRDRSPPRRARSPRDDRDRSRPRSPRPRSPPMASDSYVPGGRYVPPRRRSNSRGGPPGGLGGDRYRRDRSRDSPRRRERTRSPPPAMPARRSPMRRSPSRRGTPRRFSPGRADRFERPRSPPPRRDWGDRERDVDRRDRDDIRNRDWRDRDRSRDRDFERRDDRRDDR